MHLKLIIGICLAALPLMTEGRDEEKQEKKRETRGRQTKTAPAPQVKHEKVPSTPKKQRNQPRGIPEVKRDEHQPTPQMQRPQTQRHHKDRSISRPSIPQPKQRHEPYFKHYSRTPSLSGLGRETRQNVNPRSPASTQSIIQERKGRSLSPSERSHFRKQAEQYIQKIQKQNEKSPLKSRDSRPTLERRRESDSSRQFNQTLRQEHPNYQAWFGDTFFESHNYHPYYHRHGDRWWRRTNWAHITDWLNWENLEPNYYGGAAYSFPRESEIYPEDAAASEGDWLPIGIFASGDDVSDASYSDLFFQLAINRDGDIAGTYYNATTDETYQLEGTTIRETQQVVWKMMDNPNAALMTAGLYNLTQDVIPVEVLFADGRGDSWVFVRVNK